MRCPHFLTSSRAKRSDRAHHDWVSLAVPVGAAHLLVPGLKPHTQYQFSVLAQNKLGSGPFSEIVLSAPEGERPLAPGQQTRVGKGWQEKPGVGGLGGRRQACWAAWGPEEFVDDDPGLSFGALGEWLGTGGRGRGSGEGHWEFYCYCAYLSHSGLPTTPAAPRLPVTEMPPPLSPPRGLVAVRTPRGVLLHWDPPEMVPQRLDGYILEGRQGSQSWEVLDRAVAGTEMQLLVPGLIKVSVGGRDGASPAVLQAPLHAPDLIFSLRLDHLSSFLLPPNLPTAVSFQMGRVESGLALTSFSDSPPPGCSLRVSPRGFGWWLCQQPQQLSQCLHFW